MFQKPFVELASPREIKRPELPTDLADFYKKAEGVGREASPDYIVRLCRLEEASLIQWEDLHLLGMDAQEGWERFSAIRIGISPFFDEIVYVLDAPSCPRGSVLALGIDVSGPGGVGPYALEPSLVLASGFQSWMEHLQSVGWIEYGLIPGNLGDIPADEGSALRRYFLELNPQAAFFREA